MAAERFVDLVGVMDGMSGVVGTVMLPVGLWVGNSG